MEILITIFGAIGASLIITKSFLFYRLREYMFKYEYIGKLFTCMQCNGFWSGLILSIFILPLKYCFLIGCLVSGINYFLEILLEKIGE